MNILSLFDGISCGQVALNRAGIQIDKYYASEIEKATMEITKKHYPNTIQLGDINNWKNWELEEIDLLIGGSPCQGFSKSGKGLNFNDPRSKLFFDYVDILKHYKPKYFLLENVAMKKEWQDIISSYLGLEPISINSKLVSAQSRPRLYWTNIPNITVPEDKGIFINDILESGNTDLDKKYHLNYNYLKKSNVSLSLIGDKLQWKIPEATKKGYILVSFGQCVDLTFINSKTRRGRSMLNKSNCITVGSQYLCKEINGWFRKLTPKECERLQTLPDDYTSGISDNKRYKALGNGWTVDVVAHLFSSLKC